MAKPQEKPAEKPAEKPVAKKKVTKVIATKCTVTNPYTKDVFTKGIVRDTPKKKDSWYDSQVKAGYLKEVKM